jgi:hypothetical protein
MISGGGDGKRKWITGPMDASIEIDYDDVNHQRVDKDIKQLVQILNEHWKET